MVSLKQQIKNLKAEVDRLTAETKAAKQENYDRYQKQLLAQEAERKALVENASLRAQLNLAKSALGYVHGYMATCWYLQNQEKTA